jgi:hypothetical protein
MNYLSCFFFMLVICTVFTLVYTDGVHQYPAEAKYKQPSKKGQSDDEVIALFIKQTEAQRQLDRVDRDDSDGDTPSTQDNIHFFDAPHTNGALSPGGHHPPHPHPGSPAGPNKIMTPRVQAINRRAQFAKSKRKSSRLYVNDLNRRRTIMGGLLDSIGSDSINVGKGQAVA